MLRPPRWLRTSCPGLAFFLPGSMFWNLMPDFDFFIDSMTYVASWLWPMDLRFLINSYYAQPWFLALPTTLGVIENPPTSLAPMDLLPAQLSQKALIFSLAHHPNTQLSLPHQPKEKTPTICQLNPVTPDESHILWFYILLTAFGHQPSYNHIPLKKLNSNVFFKMR